MDDHNHFTEYTVVNRQETICIIYWNKSHAVAMKQRDAALIPTYNDSLNVICDSALGSERSRPL